MVTLRVLDHVHNMYMNNIVVDKIDYVFKKHYDAIVFNTDHMDVAVKFCDVMDGELIKQRELLKEVRSKIEHLQPDPWLDIDWTIDVGVSSVLGKHYYKVDLKILGNEFKFAEWSLFVNYVLSEEN